MRRIRRARALLAAATLTAAFIVPAMIAAPAAHAGIVDNICSATAELDFSPALDLGEQTVSMTLADAVAAGCTDSVYTGATITLDSGSGSSLCLVLDITGSGQLTWNNGQVSDLDYTVSTDPLTDSLGLNATVTSGPFMNDTIVDAPVILSVDGTCATGGVTSLTLYFGALVFTSA
jgi:hypothetical protein